MIPRSANTQQKENYICWLGLAQSLEWNRRRRGASISTSERNRLGWLKASRRSSRSGKTRLRRCGGAGCNLERAVRATVTLRRRGGRGGRGSTRQSEIERTSIVPCVRRTNDEVPTKIRRQRSRSSSLGGLNEARHTGIG